MSALRYIILLQLNAALAMGQLAPENKPPSPPRQPVAMVRSLYTQEVARHPLGIPTGADGKIFLPYLSRALLHRIELFDACQQDWFRQHPDPNLKGPFGGLGESGIFSGGDEESEPRAFHIEDTQSEEDGSFRVYVRLTTGTPPERPWNWHIAVVVVRENGRYVVNDVIYLRDPENRGPGDIDRRLSEIFSEGCNGPKWNGDGN